MFRKITHNYKIKMGVLVGHLNFAIIDWFSQKLNDFDGVEFVKSANKTSLINI